MRYTKVEKRINEIVNRLNKTKEERTVDFEAEKNARLMQDKIKRKNEIEKIKAEEDRERRRLKEEADKKCYKSVFDEASMSTNKRDGNLDPRSIEEDFF